MSITRGPIEPSIVGSSRRLPLALSTTVIVLLLALPDMTGSRTRVGRN